MKINNKFSQRAKIESIANRCNLYVEWSSDDDCMLTSWFSFVYGEAYNVLSNKVILFSYTDRYEKVKQFGELLEKELNREVELVID